MATNTSDWWRRRNGQMALTSCWVERKGRTPNPIASACFSASPGGATMTGSNSSVRPGDGRQRHPLGAVQVAAVQDVQQGSACRGGGRQPPGRPGRPTGRAGGGSAPPGSADWRLRMGSSLQSCAGPMAIRLRCLDVNGVFGSVVRELTKMRTSEASDRSRYHRNRLRQLPLRNRRQPAPS